MWFLTMNIDIYEWIRYKSFLYLNDDRDVGNQVAIWLIFGAFVFVRQIKFNDVGVFRIFLCYEDERIERIFHDVTHNVTCIENILQECCYKGRSIIGAQFPLKLAVEANIQKKKKKKQEYRLIKKF